MATSPLVGTTTKSSKLGCASDLTYDSTGKRNILLRLWLHKIITSVLKHLNLQVHCSMLSTCLSIKAFFNSFPFVISIICNQQNLHTPTKMALVPTGSNTNCWIGKQQCLKTTYHCPIYMIGNECTWNHITKLTKPYLCHYDH